jgi:hypothetical protein
MSNIIYIEYDSRSQKRHKKPKDLTSPAGGYTTTNQRCGVNGTGPPNTFGLFAGEGRGISP